MSANSIENRIVEAIRERGPLSREGLSDALGIQKPLVVSALFRMNEDDRIKCNENGEYEVNA